METLLPRIVPIAVGAAISPVVLIVNVLLLSSRTRPIARASWYAIGCAIIIQPAWRFVFAGLGAMGVNMTTLVLYLSLDAEIVRSEVSAIDDAIALAIADVIILLPVWLPLVLTVFAPTVAHRVFGPLNDFLTRHKWAIEIIVPGGFAVYLLTLGTLLLV